VLGIFRSQFEAGEPLTVVAPGTQRRNFTHVRDIVRGLILVGEHGNGDEYGLGADSSYSVLDVVKLFGGPTRMLPERRGNRMDAALDADKAKLLGWKTEHCVEDYIAEIVKSRT
jgi:UDP-glucose 4-epimerase